MESGDWTLEYQNRVREGMEHHLSGGVEEVPAASPP